MGINKEVVTRVIAEKVKEIQMFYAACYPKADYLSIAIFFDSIQFHNDPKEDKDYRIDYHENI